MKKTPTIAMLIFAIIFLGITAGLFFGVIMPGMEDRNLSKTGKQGIGYVTDVPESNTDSNGEPYYCIEFWFENDQGARVDTKTNTAYTLDELIRMGVSYTHPTGWWYNEGKAIAIRYDGNSAVADPYKTSPGEQVSVIAAIILGVLGVGFLVAFVLTALGLIGGSKIMKNGIEGTGTYIDHTSGMMVNGMSYFKIHFTFQAQNGEIVEAKTGSSYTMRQAEAIAMMGKFPIKYLGNKAVIMLDKKQILEAQQNMINNI